MEVTSLLKILSFLLLCFTAKHRPSLANAAPAAVLDSSGKELQKGVHYHIMPAIRDSGGGIGMAITHQSKRCPPDIIQKDLDGTSGIPLTFWPVNPNDTVVRLSSDLNIKFPGVTLCFQSTVWKLDSYDPFLGH
ncbi:Proteinase inhibitor I3, Kunitz legume [Parasponia andersonii]|uniref:Proteinase inhibitor I3, Kunitz legume n=1 Tax=Parasponia andersonii TaxID=3476 RepID=A0A2P5C9M8_PARAD|nr:Proteinase inhibitor I3, Kunitz legume [Parasponia andersonii]